MKVKCISFKKAPLRLSKFTIGNEYEAILYIDVFNPIYQIKDDRGFTIETILEGPNQSFKKV